MSYYLSSTLLTRVLYTPNCCLPASRYAHSMSQYFDGRKKSLREVCQAHLLVELVYLLHLMRNLHNR